jgi:hypothetical protein
LEYKKEHFPFYDEYTETVMTQKYIHTDQNLHHADAAAVRTDPGRAVADPPDILFKARVTDLEATRAIPAERQDLSATVALEFLFAPSTP